MKTKNEKVFDRAFQEILGTEGGYVNDPDDRGGETKFGISKRSYPHLDIKSLTLSEAKEIYYQDYWNVPTLDLPQIDDYKIQLELFDTAVNMGVGTAGRIFQKSLNLLNRNEKNFEDLRVDGWIGEKTLNAYHKVNKKTLLKVLNGYQFMHYVNIATDNPSQERFFNGWMKRV